MRHAGRISMRAEALVKSLGFPNGRLIYAGQEPDRYGITFVIEDSSMPAVDVGDLIPIVDTEVYTLIPSSDYILAGNILRRFSESCRAFLKIWRNWKRWK
jgi:hypothetical protein